MVTGIGAYSLSPETQLIAILLVIVAEQAEVICKLQETTKELENRLKAATVVNHHQRMVSPSLETRSRQSPLAVMTRNLHPRACGRVPV